MVFGLMVNEFVITVIERSIIDLGKKVHKEPTPSKSISVLNELPHRVLSKLNFVCFELSIMVKENIHQTLLFSWSFLNWEAMPCTIILNAIDY